MSTKTPKSPPPQEVPSVSWLDEGDLASLKLAAQRRVNLCVIEVDAGVEQAVGEYYIEAALPSAATQLLDGRFVAPGAGAWRVEEIDEQIAGPSNRTPVVCNVIVVSSADAMSVAGRDRLLKTLEEPNAATSFCFLVRDIGALPSTLLGRAGYQLRLRSSDVKARSALGETGVDADTLARYAGDWVGFLGLLPGFSGGQSTTVLRGCELWQAARPLSEASGLLTLLEDAGRDADARRQRRVLCGAWLTALSASATRALREGRATSGTLFQVLRSVEHARENLAYNSPLALVVARALSNGD